MCERKVQGTRPLFGNMKGVDYLVLPIRVESGETTTSLLLERTLIFYSIVLVATTAICAKHYLPQLSPESRIVTRAANMGYCWIILPVALSSSGKSSTVVLVQRKNE